ncbi:DUF6513 domain-containing protein [Rubripirellula amarantea]|nr:DUF6513 domain-containing protein [Rubripirellula amarantea]
MNQVIQPKPHHHFHFITGKLAEVALRDVVSKLSHEYGFAYSIGVAPITVAALITPKWLLRHWDVPSQATHVVVPGYCEQGISLLQESSQIPVLLGPVDCRSLPEWFGGKSVPVDLSRYNTRIIAEINHAPRMSIETVVKRAKQAAVDGADVIDFGCDPTQRCHRIGDYIAAIIDQGLQVSVDTFDEWEASEATRRGASLVLSVNSSNRESARDWGAEVVVIPDTPGDEKSFEKNIGFLDTAGVKIRLDPILEPIGANFAGSLVRYAKTRNDYPDHAMMMGIGNLTELTDVDSAGLNLMLLAICEELRIESVLTTEVINWARSSLRECDIARRLAYYSVRNGVPPKRLSDALVMLRDPKLTPFSTEMLSSLASSLKDNNYRLFAQDDVIHVLAAGLHLRDADPFLLFEKLMQQPASDNVDASHAFYLGYEMAKASIALTLGKQYNQDQALDWGLLTREEDLHRIKRGNRHRNS